MTIVSSQYLLLVFQYLGCIWTNTTTVSDNGTISRFGSVDDEGGTTSRTNINASLSKPIDENTFLKANAFIRIYDFELYSNFTFFLEDPINGDQIKQRRPIYFGMNAELNKK
jgi:hypothetical protein